MYTPEDFKAVRFALDPARPQDIISRDDRGYWNGGMADETLAKYNYVPVVVIQVPPLAAPATQK